jgi:rRNA maturation endonuclease Nob1
MKDVSTDPLTDSNSDTPPTPAPGDQSFLHEAQKFGKAPEKVEIDNLEEAITNVCNIMDQEAVSFFKNTKESEWKTVTMKIYCHDCRAIVPAGMGKTPRGKPRTVCGTCGSKKISSGREEALMQFYHLEKK